MDYKNKNDLVELYLEKELSSYQIAELCDCSKRTVLNWMDKHGIDRRPVGRRRVERATFGTNQGGYEYCTARTDDGTKSVGVSQLVAISNGADPHKVFDSENYETHHRNGIAWDNRPDNLQVVSKEQHRQIHKDGDKVHCPLLGCEVYDDNTRYGRVKRESVRERYSNPDWYLAI